MKTLARSCTAVAVGGALMLSVVATDTVRAEQQTYQLDMATAWSSGPLWDIGANAFAQRLAQLSNGRIQVEVHPAGAIGEPLRVTDSVRRGIADMGHTWSGYDWGRDTTTVALGGFAGTMDDERMLHWLYEGGGVELWREFREDRFNVIAMPLYFRTMETFLHSRVPVRTLEDLKGVQVRTAGAWVAMLEALGGAPVATAGHEIYPMLERGVIDATEWGSPWEDTFPRFYEVTNYVIIPGVHQPTAPFELQVNPRVWEQFSDEDKALVELAAKLVTLESWLKIGHNDADAMRFYAEEAGQEIIELDVEVQVAARQLGLDWAEEQSAENEWFGRVWESQREFEQLWNNAERYRRAAPEVRSLGME
ncbi:TRAP-type mannitol/chloroaromatic compound transport system substrate-binding protein [Natronocella acetinitrilica]|uniref:TRAP-type mannitol/chloroaromatic compound transport system substrate-binding protein n=1 Tax=Natronocella acetinitrilica TaxID=414046 RepID=A0AAE3G7D7_9GAMM|nr:TRAP transporter substrate-binding protein DctP [Natronocella acetinitrilica]MCP1675733.1 TRAP-type mannitol/chloroaromatic compound transport system substrate-binding protein [Natronocella acetinitrilica]